MALMSSSVVKSSKVNRMTPAMAEPASRNQARVLCKPACAVMHGYGVSVSFLPSGVKTSSWMPRLFWPVVTGSSPFGHISVMKASETREPVHRRMGLSAA